MANEPTQLAWRYPLRTEVEWTAPDGDEGAWGEVAEATTRRRSSVVCSAWSEDSTRKSSARRVYGRPGVLSFWRGVNGWLVRLTFRPFTWIQRSAKLIALGSMVLFPCSLANVQVSSPPSPEPTPAAIARAEAIKFVYSELAPRMFEKVDPPEIKKISEALVDECQKTGVDHLFVLAVIEAESSFDVEAVSSTGARGLMQLMPGTFREVSNAKRMFDPAENVRAGTRYIAKLYSQGFKRMDTVLLAYNQGAGGAIAVAKGEMEMPAEADVYIPKVIKRYRELLAKVGKNPKDAKKLFLVATR